MARTTRSRSIDAAPEHVWELVSDPDYLPRWWPGVVRVEDVSAERFTQVCATKRGRPVRMDQRVTVSDPPGCRAWSQDVLGTPFERLVTAWTTTITVTRSGQGSTVTITEDQDLKGSFKLGLPLQWRPARRRLDGALAALADLLE